MASQLEDAILFVSRYVAVTIETEMGTAWRVADGTIFVGENYYESLNVKEHLYPAFLLLDVWTVYVLAQKPGRLKRRAALERRHPELTELLATIDRLEAMGDLQQIFQASRSNLQEILQAITPKTLTNSTKTEIFRLALLSRAAGLTIQNRAYRPYLLDRFGPNLFEELLLKKDTDTEPSRLERFLTLTLEPYQDLQKSTQKGLTDAAITGNDPSKNEDAQEEIDFGSSTTDSKNTELEAATSKEANEDDRESQNQDEAEGVDLFESQGTADVTALLNTPLKTSNPKTLQALQELTKEDHTQAAETNPQTLAETLNFEARAKTLRPTIQKLTKIWHKNLQKGSTAKSSLARIPTPEGEILDTTRLAQTVAEAHAGTSNPAAFLPRHRTFRNEFTITHTDYIFLVDRSSSMKTRALTVADTLLVILESLAIFMRDLEFTNPENPEIRTSVILFDTDAQVVKPLSKFIDDTSRISLYTKILDASGSTNDAAALNLAATELGLTPKTRSHSDTKKRHRVAILLSDGNSENPEKADLAARALKNMGFTIWAIGIGEDTMANRFAPFFIQVQHPSEIADALQKIITRKAKK